MPIESNESLTTLTALNIMASYIGIPPLKSLNDLSTEPDFVSAQLVLDDVRQSILSQGLPCNTDYEYELNDVTDIDGFVEVPAGALICDPIDDGLVERDGLIYDTEAQEFSTKAGLTADDTWNWDFDSLPLLVKKYIVIQASRAYVARVKGDVEATQLSIPDERRVKQEFQRYVYHLGDVSVLYGEVPYLMARAGRNNYRHTNRY